MIVFISVMWMLIYFGVFILVGEWVVFYVLFMFLGVVCIFVINLDMVLRLYNLEIFTLRNIVWKNSLWSIVWNGYLGWFRFIWVVKWIVKCIKVFGYRIGFKGFIFFYILCNFVIVFGM